MDKKAAWIATKVLLRVFAMLSIAGLTAIALETWPMLWIALVVAVVASIWGLAYSLNKTDKEG